MSTAKSAWSSRKRARRISRVDIGIPRASQAADHGIEPNVCGISSGADLARSLSEKIANTSPSRRQRRCETCRSCVAAISRISSTKRSDLAAALASRLSMFATSSGEPARGSAGRARARRSRPQRAARERGVGCALVDGRRAHLHRGRHPDLVADDDSRHPRQRKIGDLARTLAGGWIRVVSERQAGAGDRTVPTYSYREDSPPNPIGGSWSAQASGRRGAGDRSPPEQTPQSPPRWTRRLPAGRSTEHADDSRTTAGGARSPTSRPARSLCDRPLPRRRERRLAGVRPQQRFPLRLC